jgi:TolB-like protein/DNA-binding winged helix-turn-helix (wHTH) protein/Flp pilus assembly protein TadD
VINRGSPSKRLAGEAFRVRKPAVLSSLSAISMASAAEEPAFVRRFGRFELNGLTGELRKDGLRVKLQDKPFRMLEALLERPGELVTREELRERLWPADTFVDFEGSLNTAVNKVRSALGDPAESPRFVETLGRRGYRFIAPLEARGPIDALASVPVAGQSRRPRALLAVGTAIGLVAALSVLAFRARSPSPPRITALAVLPLANLSNDSEQEYFADGMTDALITDLAAIRSLRVISRQSVMAYKGSRKPLPQIARELGVDGVIEGSVVRSSGRVRVTAQLVHAPTDRHLWAREYERDVRDLLALEGELSGAIAREVRAVVTPEELARLTRPRATSPAAYDDYLRGRFFWNKRSKEALEKGVAYFERAVAEDPGFALAYAGIAESYGPLSYSGFMAPGEAAPRMRAAATRAIELDDTLAEAHTALAACLAFHEWRWAAAGREFERAIEVNPNYVTAHLWRGLYLGNLGRFEEDVAERTRALSLDPLNLAANAGLGDALGRWGRLEDAERQLQKTLDLDPDFAQAHQYLGYVYLRESRSAEALAEFRKAGLDGGVGYALAVSGRHDEARRVLSDLEGKASRGYVPALEIAVVQAGLGDREQAFLWLEKAYAEHSPLLSGIRVDPRLAALHGDARFGDLVRRMNLPPL